MQTMQPYDESEQHSLGEEPSSSAEVCAWNEADEVKFVEEEEMNPNCHRKSSRRLSFQKEGKRPRHAPAPFIRPIAILAW